MLRNRDFSGLCGVFVMVVGAFLPYFVPSVVKQYFFDFPESHVSSPFLSYIIARIARIIKRRRSNFYTVFWAFSTKGAPLRGMATCSEAVPVIARRASNYSVMGQKGNKSEKCEKFAGNSHIAQIYDRISEKKWKRRCGDVRKL